MLYFIWVQLQLALREGGGGTMKQWFTVFVCPLSEDGICEDLDKILKVLLRARSQITKESSNATDNNIFLLPKHVMKLDTSNLLSGSNLHPGITFLHLVPFPILI